MPVYKYDKDNCHSFLQLIIIDSLRKIVQTEATLNGYSVDRCNLCSLLRGISKAEKASEDIALELGSDGKCERCIRFADLLNSFKVVEKRKFLHLISQRGTSDCNKYDLLYTTYAHYMLTQVLIDRRIFSMASTPGSIFRKYKKSIDELQKNFVSADSPMKLHLITEDAFCAVK